MICSGSQVLVVWEVLQPCSPHPGCTRGILCIFLWSMFSVPQSTQCLHPQKHLREAVSCCEILKMAAFGYVASKYMKTWVTYDVWWTFMLFIKQGDQLPEF